MPSCISDSERRKLLGYGCKKNMKNDENNGSSE
jgi:hypothetical protein